MTFVKYSNTIDNSIIHWPNLRKTKGFCCNNCKKNSSKRKMHQLHPLNVGHPPFLAVNNNANVIINYQQTERNTAIFNLIVQINIHFKENKLKKKKSFEYHEEFSFKRNNFFSVNVFNIIQHTML